MKRKLICIFIVLMAALLALVACDNAGGLDINNGNADLPDDVLDKLPFTVEVTGLEDVSGTGKASVLEGEAYAAALAAVKRIYYVAEDAVVYAADIKIVDAEGKEIAVGKPVTVAITMKADVNLEHNCEVFHVHDGEASQLVITVEGNKVTFLAETFSPFVLVPKHEHVYGEWHTYSEATCTEAKMEICECVCGAIKTQTVGEALGHEMTHHDMVPESCTEDGNVEYFTCSRCGKDFLEAEGFTEIRRESTIVPATGHVDADKDGICDVCRTVLKGNGGEDVCVHQPKHVAAVPATCTKDGNIEYYQCEKCGKYFSDADCTNEITLNSIMLLAMGHFDADEDGKCDKCGIDMGQTPAEAPCTAEAIGAEGSVIVLTVQNVDEAQEEAAIQLAKDAYYFDDDAEFVVVDISAAGQAANGNLVSVSVKLNNPKLPLENYIVLHIYNGAVEEIEPTVNGDMLTFSVASFSPFIFGPKHAHQPSPLIVDKAPGCTADGSSHIECIKCKKVLKTEVIPAKGHVDENGNGKCDVCGADLKETPDTPIGYVEGKVFKFDHAEGEGVINATYATAYADATLTFFADNYLEYHVFNGVRGGKVSASNMVLCGTYAIKEGESGFDITLSVTKRYYDDEETMIPISTYTFVYDVATATVAVTEYPATIYYKADADATPTKYVQPPFADNWSDAVIIAAFNAVGAQKEYTFPKLDNVLSMTKSEVDNGKVTVTIVMSSKMQGGAAASQYKSFLEENYYHYSTTNEYGNPETRINTDDNLFWCVIATGNIDGYPVLTIKISRFYSEYPDAGIANFLAENTMSDDILSFTTPWAMEYRFITDSSASPGMAYIYVGLRYRKGVERHDADVAAEFENRLTKELGYDKVTAGGKTYLCSKNKQIVLRIVTDEVGDMVTIYINDNSIFYPAKAIEEYLEGTEDAFVDLDDDSVASYSLYTNEIGNPTALRLVGRMPATADAHALVTGFENAFSGAGYKWGGFSIHLGNEEDETFYHHAWISPNNEIAVKFAAFNQGEHDFGNIAYYSVSIVNLTAIADNNKAIMTSLSAAAYSTALPGATYTFDGGIAFMYTNVGTGEEGGGMYTYDYSKFNIGTIDTSTPGERTLRISLKGNDEIYADVPVLVYGLTGITASTTKLKIDGRVAYYDVRWKYESEYSVTKYYSSGQSVTVKGNAEGIAFGDIDGTQARQDLTISCTEGGVTVSTTVAIGMFKAVNYTCTNEGIDANNAQFAIFAQGGSYGAGGWVEVNFESRRNTFGGTMYFDAEGFYIVRLSPDLDVFGSLFYDLNAEGVWNVSDYFELSAAGAGMQTFAFLNF